MPAGMERAALNALLLWAYASNVIAIVVLSLPLFAPLAFIRSLDFYAACIALNVSADEIINIIV